MVIIFILFLTVGLSSNAHHDYDKIHVLTGSEEGCVPIEEWNESQVGVEVKRPDGSYVFFSKETYIMIDGKCPICD